MKFKLTKSNIKLIEKPKGSYVAAVKTSISDVVEIDFQELANIVTIDGNAINCSEANGIEEQSWTSQQVFGLDFDSGFTHQDLVNRLSKVDIIPNIIYSTFSDNPNGIRKFRVLFILDEPITEFVYAKMIQRGLMNLFPEADKQCKDLCRMYYPGKQILGLNGQYNERNLFESICLSVLTASDKTLPTRLPNRRSTTVDFELPKVIEQFNWNKAINDIRILKVFFTENVRLSYAILFGLASNLQFIEGGLKKMFKRMEEINTLGGGQYFDGSNTNRGIEKYPMEYQYSLKSIRRYNYLPTRLCNFSPFEEDWEYNNILETTLKKGEVEILRQQDLIELKDAERVLKETFGKALLSKPFEIEYNKESGVDIMGVTYSLIRPNVIEPSIFNSNSSCNPDDIYIFKLPTGIGKTRLLENLNDCLIAFPTHRLKEEVSDLRMQVPHMVTPMYATYSVQAINDEIDAYHNCDMFSEASELVKTIASNKCFINGVKIQLTSEDIKQAKEFMLENTACRNHIGTLLTTHTRALYDTSLHTNHDTIIFDEDPLNQLVYIGACSLDFSVFNGTQFYSFTENLRKNLTEGLGCGFVSKFPKYVIPRGFKKFCAKNRRGDVVQLLESSYIFKDQHDQTKINFCRVKELPSDKKIFIMSATAPINIYKALYGKRVKVVDFTNVKHVGMVEQWTKRSFSLTGMIGVKRYSTKVFEEIFNIISGDPVITHLPAQGLFKENWSKFYFGNCSGGDELKGRDISVIGTPNKPQFVYMFYAEIIGLTNNNDFELEDQIIEWNDFRFRFYTYRNEGLRDIQLSLIESELLQACGRNRTLREMCTTKVFSSLPLKITKKFNHGK